MSGKEVTRLGTYTAKKSAVTVIMIARWQRVKDGLKTTISIE